MRIRISRASVLTLWAAIVAERLGHHRATALTLGKSVAGYAAYAKAKSLGLAEARRDAPADRRAREKVKVETIDVMGKRIPVVVTPDGVRAADTAGRPVNSASVEKYLAGKFGGGARRGARGDGRPRQNDAAGRTARTSVRALRSVPARNPRRRTRLGRRRRTRHRQGKIGDACALSSSGPYEVRMTRGAARRQPSHRRAARTATHRDDC